MEIFQTIWTALTTENELLTNIIVLPIGFIESLIDLSLFTTVLNLNIGNKARTIYIAFFSIFVYLSNIFIPNPIKSILNLVVIILSVHLILHISIFKSILCMIISISINVLCESLITKILSLILNFNVLELLYVPAFRLLVGLLVQFNVFLIYLIIKYFKLQIKIFDYISKKSKHIVIVNYIIAIFTIFSQFLITGFYLDRLPIYIVIFSNITLIAYFLLSIYTISKTTELELTYLNLEQEKEHNRILKLAQDDIRGFRHDFTNIICTIGGYVHTKDMEGLTNYYNQIQKDVVKVNNLTALNPDIINNPAIYALITSKYDKAADLNISMSVEVFTDLNSLPMKIYEFTRILGILLDNAIEAAQECNEKNVYIHIRKDEKHNRQLLIVENTYKDKTIDTDKIFEKNYSTKPKNTGLGLWEVRQILKRNNNLNLYTTKNERLFKQQLEIYNI